MPDYAPILAEKLMSQPGASYYTCNPPVMRRTLREAIKIAEAKDGRWYKPHYRQNERHLVEIIE